MALASQLSAATKLARSMIYQWCHENYVPHLKLEDSIRFRPADVMTYSFQEKDFLTWQT
jgi:hypothetical protein